MATAKQIAARKRFAAMAKNGTLARLRRKRNPGSGSGEDDSRVFDLSNTDSGFDSNPRRRKAPAKRKKNPHPGSQRQVPDNPYFDGSLSPDVSGNPARRRKNPHPGTIRFQPSESARGDGGLQRTYRDNPKTRQTIPRTINPKTRSAPAPYAIICGAMTLWTKSLPDAKKVARIIADKTGKQVAVVKA